LRGRLPLLALAVAVVLTTAACSELPLPNEDAEVPEAGQNEDTDGGVQDPEPVPDLVDDEGGDSVPGDVGNPEGGADVPAEAGEEDASDPDTVIGDGTADGCTSDAVVSAVADGGVVTFDCGPDPVTITMTGTAVMESDNLVLDGGGTVTLSGGGEVRILEADRCIGMNEPRWCQSGPSLTLQNISLVDADSSDGKEVGGAEDGGGAVLARGTRVKVVNSRFADNRCVAAGADPGGAGLRLITTPIDEPSFVVNSTFENGQCSNGGAISGLHADLAVYNSRFTGNEAIGRGQNHPDPNGGTDGVGLDGQPGGGLGGAIYLDGQSLGLEIAGTVMEDNQANELGGAVFFVDNPQLGSVSIDSSTLSNNPATEQDRWGSTPGLYIQGVEGFPNEPLTDDQISDIVTNTTLE
jgi:hypothetical protein